MNSVLKMRSVDYLKRMTLSFNSLHGDKNLSNSTNFEKHYKQHSKILKNEAKMIENEELDEMILKNEEFIWTPENHHDLIERNEKIIKICEGY